MQNGVSVLLKRALVVWEQDSVLREVGQAKQANLILTARGFLNFKEY